MTGLVRLSALRRAPYALTAPSSVRHRPTKPSTHDPRSRKAPKVSEKVHKGASQITNIPNHTKNHHLSSMIPCTICGFHDLRKRRRLAPLQPIRCGQRRGDPALPTSLALSSSAAPATIEGNNELRRVDNPMCARCVSVR